VANERRTPGITDIVLMAIIAATGLLAAVAILFGYERPIVAIAILGLTAVALDGVYGRMRSRVDHMQAMQSHQILEIANESLSWFRQGLTFDTAQAVCRIALQESQAAAVLQVIRVDGALAGAVYRVVQCHGNGGAVGVHPVGAREQ
jgi:LytS/YehU family sensor histidine kinase